MKTRGRWRILLHELGRRRGRFAAGVVLLLATNFLALAIPWMLKFAVDAIQRRENSSRIAAIAAAIGGVAILQAIVRTSSRVSILGASRHIVYELRNRFFERLITLPASFFDRYRTGDLMSRAVNDMMLIRSFFGPGIMNLANTILSWTGAIVLMAAIDLRLTLWSLIPYPFVLVAMNRLSRSLYRGSQRTQEQLAVLSSRAQENLAGMAQVKAYDMEEREIADFTDLARELRSRNLFLARVRGAVVPLMGSVGGIGTLLVLWIGTRHIIEGTLTLGEFVAFNAYLASLAWPTIAMGWILNVFQRSQGAIERIGEILEADDPGRIALHPEALPLAAPSSRQPLPAAIELSASLQLTPAHSRFGGDRPADELRTGGAERTNVSPPRGQSPEIVIENLSFSYAGTATPALDRVSFRVAPGGVVGVVGPVASGKTTLLRLLARLYTAPIGAIRLDGAPLDDLDEGTLRSLLAVVPQESFLFSMPLADNLALGRPGALRDEIEEVGRKAGLGADLVDLPQGYDTPVGERGYTLSGGQRQRAALARALLMKPRVLLLDDPFASIDASTEEAILAELAALDGMTRIVAGHRVSAVAGADEILVLDKGRIVERGRHEVLIAAGGLYSRMFERQRTEREIERA